MEISLVFGSKFIFPLIFACHKRKNCFHSRCTRVDKEATNCFLCGEREDAFSMGHSFQQGGWLGET